MNYKYANIFVSLLCVFAKAFSMEIGENEPTENNISEEHSISSSAQVSSKQQSLQNLVAQFLAKKLMKNIRSDIETGSKEEAYKKYLALTRLNGPAKELILKALAKNESNLLWKILPINIAQQAFDSTQDETTNLRGVIVLNNNQLLVIYDEANKISKINIWDMETGNWIETNLLPELRVYKAFVSNDGKALFLWCFGYYILVYDLENKCAVSRIISSPNVIRSVCLLNDDKLVCGTSGGTVKIYDWKSGQQIFSFDANKHQAIELVDALNDLIVTVDAYCIQFWKLNKGEEPECVGRIFSVNASVAGAAGVKLCANGQKVFILFAYCDKQILKFMTLPELQILSQNKIRASLNYLRYENFFVNNLNGQITVLPEFYDFNVQDQFFHPLRQLILLDRESGEIINKIDLSKILLPDKIDIKWDNFAISPNNDYIILYNKKGNIAKISLSFDQDLEKVLSDIKSELENQRKCVDPNNSLCLVS